MQTEPEFLIWKTIYYLLKNEYKLLSPDSKIDDISAFLLGSGAFFDAERFLGGPASVRKVVGRLLRTAVWFTLFAAGLGWIFGVYARGARSCNDIFVLCPHLSHKYRISHCPFLLLTLKFRFSTRLLEHFDHNNIALETC